MQKASTVTSENPLWYQQFDLRQIRVLREDSQL